MWGAIKTSFFYTVAFSTYALLKDCGKARNAIL